MEPIIIRKLHQTVILSDFLPSAAEMFDSDSPRLFIRAASEDFTPIVIDSTECGKESVFIVENSPNNNLYQYFHWLGGSVDMVFVSLSLLARISSN